jgi:ubiquinone/menaquinone biosynthesis C-methylase UbiE
MKVRDSGMPGQGYWESLFDIHLILDRLKIDQQVGDVVELGCGYGTFTLPVAQRVSGTVHAFDIEPEMIEVTRKRAADTGVTNVSLTLADVVANGFGLPNESVDAVLLFNILHTENPQRLLHFAADVLRPGGRVLAIHWRSDLTTPRGPDLSIRPRPEQIADWGKAVGLKPAINELLPPWHFGLVLARPA